MSDRRLRMPLRERLLSRAGTSSQGQIDGNRSNCNTANPPISISDEEDSDNEQDSETDDSDAAIPDTPSPVFDKRPGLLKKTKLSLNACGARQRTSGQLLGGATTATDQGGENGRQLGTTRKQEAWDRFRKRRENFMRNKCQTDCQDEYQDNDFPTTECVGAASALFSSDDDELADVPFNTCKNQRLTLDSGATSSSTHCIPQQGDDQLHDVCENLGNENLDMGFTCEHATPLLRENLRETLSDGNDSSDIDEDELEDYVNALTVSNSVNQQHSTTHRNKRPKDHGCQKSKRKPRSQLEPSQTAKKRVRVTGSSTSASNSHDTQCSCPIPLDSGIPTNDLSQNRPSDLSLLQSLDTMNNSQSRGNSDDEDNDSIVLMDYAVGGDSELALSMLSRGEHSSQLRESRPDAIPVSRVTRNSRRPRNSPSVPHLFGEDFSTPQLVTTATRRSAARAVGGVTADVAGFSFVPPRYPGLRNRRLRHSLNSRTEVPLTASDHLNSETLPGPSIEYDQPSTTFTSAVNLAMHPQRSTVSFSSSRQASRVSPPPPSRDAFSQELPTDSPRDGRTPTQTRVPGLRRRGTRQRSLSGAASASLLVSPQTRANHQMAEDEAMARRLQEEMDREFAATLEVSASPPPHSAAVGDFNVWTSPRLSAHRHGHSTNQASRMALRGLLPRRLEDASSDPFVDVVGEMEDVETASTRAGIAHNPVAEQRSPVQVSRRQRTRNNLSRNLSTTANAQRSNVPSRREALSYIDLYTQLHEFHEESEILQHDFRALSDVLDSYQRALPPRYIRRRQRGRQRSFSREFANSFTENDYQALLDLGDQIGEVKPKGLSNHEIQMLPTKIYRETEVPADGSKECNICFGEYVDGNTLRLLQCFHYFHDECIDRWLRENPSCPICRVEVKLD